MSSRQPFDGRGARINPANRFEKQSYSHEEGDYIEPDEERTVPATDFLPTHPKTILNKVESTDLPMAWSMNPYQGCEHGCVYCYARPTHEYWGYSAGLDFEQKILYKENAPALLRAAFEKPSWQPQPIMLAGNTDCYQPVERKLRLTRGILEACLEYRNPVGLITKNSLILRDLDLLKELAALRLVHVNISLTTLDEDLRRRMEPRTATARRRLLTMKTLSEAGIPVNAMIAPVIPGLTDHEIPKLVETAAAHGASSVGYTLVRLNGAVADIFADWIREHYPNKAEKVLKQVSEAHGGTLGDSRSGLRMVGEGRMAESIRSLFRLAKAKHLAGREYPPYDLTQFRRRSGEQMKLF